VTEPEITIEELGDGVVIVGVAGDLTFANAERLARELHAALDAGAVRLVVDVSDVGFMDSAGLAALLRAATTARRSDAAVALVHEPAGPPRILHFKGVEQLMRMFGSREQALAASGA